MTILQAAYHEVALANSRLRTENDVMRARLTQLETEVAELRDLLVAYEGQLTAEEMRERCAQWHEDRARIAMSSTHHGDKEHAILAAHCRADWHENVADELRSLPTKREEG